MSKFKRSNSVKHTFWTMFIASALILAVTGCSSAATTTPIPSVPLGGTDTSASGQVKASAKVVPVQESRLSFVISGLVEEVAVKEGDKVEAGQTLVQLDTTELEFDIVAAKAALTSAETDAQIQRQPRKKFNLDTFKFTYESAPPEKLQAADAKVDQMQSALEAAKASLAQGTLVAPFVGTVTTVDVQAGEYVNPGQVIITLAKLDELQIETTDLSELDVATVKIGQPATVFVEALNDNFPGKVTAISPISNKIGGDVVFKVTIKLEEQPEALLWGMSADVEINTQ
jgi:membrane fusion protein (multidrug efflux system)